ncbi:Calcium channel YVC1 [Cyphellophora attinorum]|uniref:Calcium channel YVC1 n=1 Tax=Cyphellophora attinorum TaxID=1664694 RepID=A0A0N1NYE4_9EURO|nr:Calcium channel YVC1 [Phialophora attinorum]KPI39152.1 Calcium channel YVC1 [Phialophora attinorum]
MYPGNSGTSRTRAMLCELLAIRLLREYSTRELIDALSYDFDPLQGQVEPAAVTVNGTPTAVVPRRPQRVARVSCYEVALRAQAKRFLAHPTVVQQLEAIWAGTIVFHSAADSMHRKLPNVRQLEPSYGTVDTSKGVPFDPKLLRRAVTIYDPNDASLMKLSRLRVPRYRNILSTLSFAVLLGLFVAVLIERSLEITTLEVVFWFWAGGYMLDEIVGFNEQGFSLYIASFWNTFDLGILLLLFIHLCLRIYGIVMVDVRKHTIANMAYDVLAADAILLFPRLFSVLDHYKYFSQLLIAFRMMAQDLMAIFLLILISCSGFFVSLTLSFGNDKLDTPGNVAYALLQILMGFTPAAWDRWENYNTLGKIILTLFLFIAHFLIVVILITVLTNSFMEIVKNANEEHQFVFAVNTIASVKSDALFSYVAPTNILQWLLTPLRYFIPFRQYVKVNRTIIKVTHFPILFAIYSYEKVFLGSSVYDSLEYVERGRPKRSYAPKVPRLARAPSIATFRQDRALDEVFRRVPDSTLRKEVSQDRRQTSTAVNNWMTEMGDDLTAPLEQDRKIVDRLERQRPSGQWGRSMRARQNRLGSVASDPEEFRSMQELFSPGQLAIPEEVTPSQVEGPSQHTDADGDDELAATEHDDEATNMDQSGNNTDSADVMRLRLQPPMDYFSRHGSPRARAPKRASPVQSRKAPTDEASDAAHLSSRPSQHQRNFSTATQIYRPESGSEQPEPKSEAVTQPASGTISHRTSPTTAPAL